MLTICKFGGSSVACASQLKKVKNIVLSNPYRKVVVTSASGKRNKEDNKITDLLYLLCAHIKYGVNADHIWNEVYDRYNEIKTDLGLSYNLEAELTEIRKHVEKTRDEAYLVSRGEYLSARLLAEYLDYRFVDAASLFIFDYDGKLNLEKSFAEINKLINPEENICVPGFYGRNIDGSIHLFSRGGSDITGSILASAMNADKYENWTDVSGILMADPKIISNPKKITSINYDELREMSYMGASVIHEATLVPLAGKNIPINILNTNEPENPGTIIAKEAPLSNDMLTGITGKKNYLTITIVKDLSANKVDVLSDALAILKRHNVVVEHVPTSIDSFSIVIDSSSIKERLYSIISELEHIEGVTEVTIDEDLALVALIGRNMAAKPGNSGRIFSILGNEGINIKMIAQGTKELTIIIGVSNNDFKRSISVLYDKLVLEK